MHSKFGIPLSDFDELSDLVAKHDVRVIGLQAHTGNGVFNVDNWREVADTLIGLAPRFKAAHAGYRRWSGCAGKLGARLRYRCLVAGAGRVQSKHAGIQLWMEPGRYLVAEAGVLLAQSLSGRARAKFNTSASTPA
jgi:diaminopimelate decarboxylase/aspartate kinase